VAASNYMTVGDTRSIWKTALTDTTRFGKVGVRIAEMLNFLVNGDATSQVVSTACTPIMEQISEEILFELIQASKGTDVGDPWVWIQANVSKISWRYYDNYLLKKVRQKLGYSKIEMVTRRLPTTTDSNVIP